MSYYLTYLLSCSLSYLINVNSCRLQEITIENLKIIKLIKHFSH